MSSSPDPFQIKLIAASVPKQLMGQFLSIFLGHQNDSFILWEMHWFKGFYQIFVNQEQVKVVTGCEVPIMNSSSELHYSFYYLVWPPSLSLIFNFLDTSTDTSVEWKMQCIFTGNVCQFCHRRLHSSRTTVFTMDATFSLPCRCMGYNLYILHVELWVSNTINTNE